MEQAYKDLMQKYNSLLEENKRLKDELALLKGETCLPMPEFEIPTEFSTSTINKYSSSEEKINLFRSLFKAREDVFARRWYSKTTDKSGYQPVCENEWNEEFCDKKKFKRSACPNRKLMTLTDKDIYRHLSGKDSYGRDVVGIYPMLTDETCLFLCADFDEENFKSDVTAFRKTCEEFDIPISVEISRSGNGAHAWIFFEEPVSASVARKLGSGILTKTMEESNLSFKSYDRFFPNQDTMPKGGFGNLVALPLQGNARKNGNSLFVDENFSPHPDQWEYLGSIQKLSSERVDELVSALCKSGDLGELISEKEDKPWETKRQIVLSVEEYPESLEIVYSNMLYVPTKDLSAGLINKIKRLAAFKNPDFYRSQAMRLPIYNKPRIICTAEMFDEYIALPRGCEDALVDLFSGTKTIKSAHKEVLIVCPFMRKNRISQILKIFSQAILNGATLTVITRPPEDFKEPERETIKENTAILQNCDVNVIYKSEFHQKFTVIDNKIVWYGSVNFLSFGTNEESIMRFVSFDVAGELKDTVM